MVWRDFPFIQATQQLGCSFYMEDKAIGPDSKRTGTEKLLALKPWSKPTA